MDRNSTFVKYYRIGFAMTGVFSVGTRIVLNILHGPTPIHNMRFFTLQSNTMVMTWMILAILWANSENYEMLIGFTKGALTTYITITFLVFNILIAPTFHPVGIDWWTSLFNHYINPWAFIIDFLLVEREEYQWKWPVYWLIYPIIYLIFAVIWSAATSEFLYSFLNYKELGWSGFTMWVLILFVLFFLIGSLYTFLSRKILFPRSQ